jgi:phosphoadenosine phosphosulfate reductase
METGLRDTGNPGSSAGPADDERSPEQVLETAAQRFTADRIAISFSGAEDVVLIDMAHRLGLQFGVFSLDTGRLHPETYRFIDRIREHYQIDVDMLMPDPAAVSALVREKGLFSFYRDGHGECCAVRKIGPLRRKLANLDAWITGQRQDQSVTRVDLPIEQEDHAFGSAEHPLVKFNPLSTWRSADVWAYIREAGVPYNPLHERGFVSIGCEPCTRPVGPHEHERAGRWWWEEATQKECGLHVQNVVKIVS